MNRIVLLFVMFVVLFFLSNNLYSMLHCSGNQNRKDICISILYVDDQIERYSFYNGIAPIENISDYIDINKTGFFSKYLLRINPMHSVSIVEDFLKEEELFALASPSLISNIGVACVVDNMSDCCIEYILTFFKEYIDGAQKKVVHIYYPGQKTPFFCAQLSESVRAYKTYKLLGKAYIIFVSRNTAILFDLETGKELAKIRVLGTIIHTTVFAGDQRLIFLANNYVKAVDIGCKITPVFNRKFDDIICDGLSRSRYLALSFLHSKKVILFNFYQFEEKLADLKINQHDNMFFLHKSCGVYFCLLKDNGTAIDFYRLSPFEHLLSRQFRRKIDRFDIRSDQGDELISIDIKGGKRLRYEL